MRVCMRSVALKISFFVSSLSRRNNQKIKKLTILNTLFLTFTLTACGGGSSSEDVATAPVTPPPITPPPEPTCFNDTELEIEKTDTGYWYNLSVNTCNSLTKVYLLDKRENGLFFTEKDLWSSYHDHPELGEIFTGYADFGGGVSLTTHLYGEGGVASGQPTYIYKYKYGDDYMVKKTVADEGHSVVEDYIFDHEDEFDLILNITLPSKVFEDLGEAYPDFNILN